MFQCKVLPLCQKTDFFWFLSIDSIVLFPPKSQIQLQVKMHINVSEAAISRDISLVSHVFVMFYALCTSNVL